jgi:RNA polymerase-binding transcription factor DksA
MRARSEQRDVVQPKISGTQVDEIRTLLLAAIAEQYTEFERCEARLAADWPGDTTGLIPAMAALKMFTAREAIEAIAAALARIDDGDFGICPSCDRPLPLELLEAIPPVRFCVDCQPPDRLAPSRAD